MVDEQSYATILPRSFEEHAIRWGVHILLVIVVAILILIFMGILIVVAVTIMYSTAILLLY